MGTRVSGGSIETVAQKRMLGLASGLRRARHDVRAAGNRSWAGGRVSHGELIFSMNHGGQSLFAPHSAFRLSRGQTERASRAPTPER